MKKFFSIAIAAVLALGLMVGCQKKDDSKPESSTVTTNGSTSMESVIGILSEQFMKDNENISITYDATGSGTGVESARTGVCDIGLASRGLKDEEKAKGLKETTVALDGIAIIVNPENPVEDLTVEQIYDIFTGKVTSWSEFGGEGDIACIGREAGSGTRDGFESITKTKDSCVLRQELTSTGAVITAVKSSPNAIGYASLSAVEGKDDVKVLKVEGEECTAENVKSGKYVIQRPFNLITKDGVALSDAAQKFFDYMISPEAAPLISKAGAVPVAK